MLSARKYVCPVLGGMALIVGALGCGSSTTNNDQGVAFSAIGYFSAATPEPPPGVSGIDTTLASDTVANGLVGKQTTVFIGLENRLRNQFIRVTKIDCDYNIPGSTLAVPHDVIAVSGFINASPSIGGPQIGGAGGSGGVGSTGAVGGTGTTGGTGTGGSGGTGNNLGGASSSGGPATGVGSKSYIEFNVIGPAIYSFLNNNRNALPELPFQMQAICSATGISAAGDVFETNPLALQIGMFEENEFPDPNGTGGTGTGGDFDSFDGSDPAASGSSSTVTGDSSALNSEETSLGDDTILE